MMELSCAGDSAQLSMTARPNSALGSAGLRIAMAVLLPVCLATGTAFLMLGAWPATAFMAVPLVGLACAFHHIRRHAGDYERLTLDDNQLVLDRHTPKGDQHLEFNSQWVQLLMGESEFGVITLALRSHGREVSFGRLLSDDERAALGVELRRRLIRIRH